MKLKIRKHKKYGMVVLLTLGLSLIFGGWNSLLSQEYITGKGDKLSITFWQQTDLNTTVTINQKGEIDLPVIGLIKADGMTIQQLSNKIVDEITIFNPNITQARIEVLSYENNRIYVTGFVLDPGKYTFEVIPNLWAVILEAGGPEPDAFLNQVRIIRGETARDANISNVTFNLEKNLNEGNFEGLPALYPGDNVFVPGLSVDQGESGVGAQTSRGISFSQMGIQNVYIFGQVSSPGIFPMEERMDLLRALVLAGGTTDLADLKKVQIVSQRGFYPTVVKFNLKEYMSKGEVSSLLVNPGDTIYIPEKGSILEGPSGTFFDNFFRAIGFSLASILVYRLFE